jgi:signal peptidase I
MALRPSGGSSGPIPGAFLESTDATASAVAGARRQMRRGRVRGVREWIIVLVGALVVAFVVRGFVLQSFFIPSGSMEPTLLVHDRVLVNRLAYKTHKPNRGDVIVFARPPGVPSDDKVKDLIKRVIGLPGDTIEFKEDKVIVNGRILNEPYLTAGTPTKAKTLGDKIVVPDGKLLVLGDNRENSHDGRFFGPIDQDLIVGRAFVLVWPVKDIGWL